MQNQYNLAHRGDDTLSDALAADGIAYVPFFSLGGFNPFQALMQVALAWLPRRSPNILLIPGTSSKQTCENLLAAPLDLTHEAMAVLNRIGG